MAPYLKPVDQRWRNLLAFLLTDQAFAASITALSRILGRSARQRLLLPRRRRRALAGLARSRRRRHPGGSPSSRRRGSSNSSCRCAFIALLAPLLRDRHGAASCSRPRPSRSIALDAMPMRLSTDLRRSGSASSPGVSPTAFSRSATTEADLELASPDLDGDRRRRRDQLRRAAVVHRAVRPPRHAGAAGDARCATFRRRC